MPERRGQSVWIADQVQDFLRALPPEARRAVRRGLGALGDGRGDVRALEGALEGYHRLRVGSYRVVFRYGVSARGPAIYCVFAERRALVYVLVEQLLEGALRPVPARKKTDA